MSASKFLHADWKGDLARLCRSAKSDLLIASPFVSREGAEFVIQHIQKEARPDVRLRFMANLAPQNVCQGVTEPEALLLFSGQIGTSHITHLPRLHAKVFIADTRCAIITSGNLTAGGLMRNHEYGVLVTQPADVARVRHDMEVLEALGTRVADDELLTYCKIAESVRNAFHDQLASVERQARRRFDDHFRKAGDHLIRLRLRGSSPTKIFEDTILHLLRTRGPLSTAELHPEIQSMHPDICDDAVDRIIDGQRYGKRWKHMVRAAQSHLKDRGLARMDGGKWRLVSDL
jgi:hypothetical protein